MSLPPLVVVPTYDERDNIGRVMTAVTGLGFHLLVVDDASPDGTADVVADRATRVPGVALLRRPAKVGLGPAYAAGFAQGLAAGHSVICQMDADLSHDPTELPELISRIERGAGLAIGSRYVPGGATEGWPAHRQALSRWGNRYATWILGISIKDATAGFRAWSDEALTLADPATCASTGYGFQVEMAWRAITRGVDVVEVPITFRERTRGRSKMSAAIALEAMVGVTRWGVRRRLER